VLLAGLYFFNNGVAPERETIPAPSPTTPTAAQSDQQKSTTAQQPQKEKKYPPEASDATRSKPKIATRGSPETGRGSWYKLDAVTASGEAMDGDALTAAHPHLLIGTQVLVENLDNGRSVIVRINDRGPFTHNRIIDLSEAAAEQLDLIADGDLLAAGPYSKSLTDLTKAFSAKPIQTKQEPASAAACALLNQPRCGSLFVNVQPH
jgi:rare lipoprotein A